MLVRCKWCRTHISWRVSHLQAGRDSGGGLEIVFETTEHLQQLEGLQTSVICLTAPRRGCSEVNKLLCAEQRHSLKVFCSYFILNIQSLFYSYFFHVLEAQICCFICSFGWFEVTVDDKNGILKVLGLVLFNWQNTISQMKWNNEIIYQWKTIGTW